VRASTPTSAQSLTASSASPSSDVGNGPPVDRPNPRWSGAMQRSS
jgi:hypothetical protein